MSVTAFRGMVTTTSSPACAASSTVPAVALAALPAARACASTSATSASSVSGPREFATTTSWPTRVNAWARWEPMFPDPMIPMVVMRGCNGSGRSAFPVGGDAQAPARSP